MGTTFQFPATSHLAARTVFSQIRTQNILRAYFGFWLIPATTGVGSPAHRPILQATSTYYHASRAEVPRSNLSRVWADFKADFACVFHSFACVFRQKLENIGAGANPRLQLLAAGRVRPGAQLHQFSCPNSISEVICFFVKVYTFGFPWNNITYDRQGLEQR